MPAGRVAGVEQPGVTGLAVVTGARPGGWRRRCSNRCSWGGAVSSSPAGSGSLTDGREPTVRRVQVFSDDWPWEWRAEDLARWVATRGWAHSTVRCYQDAVAAAFCGYVTDPRYGRVGECEQRVGGPTEPVLAQGQHCDTRGHWSRYAAELARRRDHQP